MLVNSQKFNYRHLSVCLVLLTALTLSSCGKKGEDTAETNTPGDSTAQTTPGGTTTARETNTTKSTAGGGTLSAEAKKLGVKPTGTTCPPNAPIKGNVNKNNKKIYHEAKEAGFDKIKPELCFADAATAKKAGFVARKAGTPKVTKTP
jgi:PBP1b-binding outer membrane lipoprotein LpoB